jgi:hypothetical protein
MILCIHGHMILCIHGIVPRGTWRTLGRKVGVGICAVLDYNERYNKASMLSYDRQKGRRVGELATDKRVS